jgi:hypothetical protein
LNEDPTRQLDRRDKQLDQKAKEKQARALQALNEGSRQYTKQNPDGSFAIDYSGLAGYLSSKGHADVAQTVLRDQAKRQQAETLAKENEFKRQAETNRYVMTNLERQLGQVPEGSPPQAYGEITSQLLQHANENFNTKYTPEMFTDEQGNFSLQKVAQQIEGAKHGPLGLEQEAGLRGTNAVSSGVEQENVLRGAETGLTTGATDPNSQVSRQAQQSGVDAGLPRSYVSGKSATFLSTDPKYNTAIANTQNIKHQTELSQVAPAEVVQGQGSIADKARQDLNQVTETINIINELRRQEPSLWRTTIKKISPRMYGQFTGDKKMLAAIGALENLDASIGFKGDINDTPEALLANLQAAASRLKLQIDQAEGRGPQNRNTNKSNTNRGNTNSAPKTNAPKGFNGADFGATPAP